MNKIRRAVLISLLGENSLQVINFVAIAILARLLTPEEIGLFAVAMAIAFVAAEIRSFGVSELLIRERSISDELIRKVLGAMVIMSWGIGSIIIFASPLISSFFSAEHLAPILCIVAIPFFFAPHSAVPVAIISRDLNFDVIFKIHLVGCVGGNLLKIILVYFGHSYYGLAWGTVFGVVLEFIAITCYRPTGIPWVPRFKGILEVFKVGSKIATSKFLATFSQNSVDIVLGKVLNMHSVGMFSRGFGLILFVQNILIKAITPVALPHFSEISRNDGALKKSYLESSVLIGVVTMPVFAVVSLCATDLITTLFGDQWTEAGELASVLTIWAFISSVHCFSSSLFVSVSKENYLLGKEVISIFVKLTCLLCAIPFGLKAVAWSFVISGAVEFIVVTYLLKHLIGLTFRETVKSFISNFGITFGCWFSLFLMYTTGLFENFSAFLTLLFIALALTPIWLLGVVLTSHPILQHFTRELASLR